MVKNTMTKQGANPEMLRIDDIRAAHKNIAAHIHNTPVLTSDTLNKITDAQLFFKTENLQKGGAFKIRGATNALMAISKEDRSRGVIAHSSGNHAQAIALSCKKMGIFSTIVMPDVSPKVKIIATRDTYGANVIFCENSVESRHEVTQTQIDKYGFTLVHAFDNDNVIAGAGTACLELMESIAYLDIIICPVGGGGLLSGTSLYARALAGNNVKIYGAEPQNANDAKKSLDAGKIIENPAPPDTIADGLRTNLCERTFSYISQNVDDILTVSENSILGAMQLIWERMKIIIEPSSAVPMAAILTYPELFHGKKVGIILSGGNIDVSDFFKKLRKSH